MLICLLAFGLFVLFWGFNGLFIKKNTNNSSNYMQNDIADEKFTVRPILVNEAEERINLDNLWEEARVFIEEKKLNPPIQPNAGPLSVRCNRNILFNHDDINRFYRNHIYGNRFFAVELDAIIEIMEILDLHGDCSSITTIHRDEPEKKTLPKNALEILSRVSLCAHSINVAEIAMTKFDTAKEPYLTSQVILACLSHDIGKIKEFMDKFAVCGVHQVASLAILEQLETVKILRFNKELKDTVRLHHSGLQKNNRILQILIESDHTAREKEIAPLWLDIHLTRCAAVSGEENRLLGEGDEAPFGNIGVEETTILTAADDKVEPATGTIDVSAWFQPKRFVKEISMVLNTSIQDGEVWSGLTLKDYSYFQPNAFLVLIQRHAQCNTYVSSIVGEKAKQQILLSVVQAIEESLPGTIATEFLRSNHYGTKFNVTTKDGMSSRRFLIPFRSESLLRFVDNPEARKTPNMQNIKEISLFSKK